MVRVIMFSRNSRLSENVIGYRKTTERIKRIDFESSSKFRYIEQVIYKVFMIITDLEFQ